MPKDLKTQAWIRELVMYRLKEYGHGDAKAGKEHVHVAVSANWDEVRNEALNRGIPDEAIVEPPDWFIEEWRALLQVTDGLPTEYCCLTGDVRYWRIEREEDIPDGL